MKDFDFKKILSTYETKRTNISTYACTKKSESELQVIKQDIDRSFNFMSTNDAKEQNSLKRILYEILTTIPVDYIQSMSEIASIIVYYYFHQEVTDSVEEESVEIDHDLLEKAKIAITNILKEKVEPLIVNDFAMYLRYNKIFLIMMEKRGKPISPEESMKYMNNTLTWFCRSIDSIEDIFVISGYILACPTSFYFLLLVKFFDQIENKKKIKKLSQNLYHDLIGLEKEFLETENEVKDKKKIGIDKKDLLIAGSIVAVAGALIYNLYKKDR